MCSTGASLRTRRAPPQDFDELKQKITKRVQAVVKKNEELGRVVARSIIKDTGGLNQHELVALATVMQNAFLSNGYVAGYQIRNDMNTSGFTDLAVSLALKTLAIKGMITTDLWTDNRDGDPYAVYKVSAQGEQWLIDNQDKLTLRMERLEQSQPPDNDVPF